MSESTERGYRNFLSLDAIVAEARSIADTDGLDAVSMRGLADRLGCTPRALYRHVSDKEQVLELVADTALATLAPPARDGAWQTSLFDFLTNMYELLVASPAVATIVATQVVAERQFHTHADNVVALLVDGGLPADLAAEAMVVLAQFTLGAALPGQSQRLHEVYRRREFGDREQALPALHHVQRHFVEQDAGTRYRTALRRLIRAYESATEL
jgi:AcrR family transcriptional regulator